MLLNYMKVAVTQTRTYALKHNPKKLKDVGVKYGRITYFPRHPDHKDPPIEPSKLFMIQRVKPYRRLPYWDKELLDMLDLQYSTSKIAIVKNIPELNAMLWKIKHLIKITPIQLPNGIPKDGERTGTFLHENGIFVVSPQLIPDERRIEATKKFMTDPKRMDRETIKTDCRLQWLNPW